ncbi:hypothetical protein ACO0QE_000803 [Hanseniaspora vineae]
MQRNSSDNNHNDSGNQKIEKVETFDKVRKIDGLAKTEETEKMTKTETIGNNDNNTSDSGSNNIKQEQVNPSTLTTAPLHHTGQYYSHVPANPNVIMKRDTESSSVEFNTSSITTTANSAGQDGFVQPGILKSYESSTLAQHTGPVPSLNIQQQQAYQTVLPNSTMIHNSRYMYSGDGQQQQQQQQQQQVTGQVPSQNTSALPVTYLPYTNPAQGGIGGVSSIDDFYRRNTHSAVSSHLKSWPSISHIDDLRAATYSANGGQVEYAMYPTSYPSSYPATTTTTAAIAPAAPTASSLSTGMPQPPSLTNFAPYLDQQNQFYPNSTKNPSLTYQQQDSYLNKSHESVHKDVMSRNTSDSSVETKTKTEELSTLKAEKSSKNLRISNKPARTLTSYLCDVCHKRFKRPSTLATHQNIHTGKRPFACDFPHCHKTFNVKSNLARHMKCHSRKLRDENNMAAIYNNRYYMPSNPSSLTQNQYDTQVFQGADVRRLQGQQQQHQQQQGFPYNNQNQNKGYPDPFMTSPIGNSYMPQQNQQRQYLSHQPALSVATQLPVSNSTMLSANMTSATGTSRIGSPLMLSRQSSFIQNGLPGLQDQASGLFGPTFSSTTAAAPPTNQFHTPYSAYPSVTHNKSLLGFASPQVYQSSPYSTTGAGNVNPSIMNNTSNNVGGTLPAKTIPSTIAKSITGVENNNSSTADYSSIKNNGPMG